MTSPPSPVRPRPRWPVRAALATAVTVASGVTAHAGAGGGSPDPGVLVLLSAVVLPVAALAVRARVGRLRALALVAAGQYAVHHALSAVTPGAAAHPAPVDGHGGATSAHADTSLCAPTGHAGAGHADSSVSADALTASGAGAPVGAGGGAAMTAAHLLATVAAALVLLQGDRAATALRSALSRPWRVPAVAWVPLEAAGHGPGPDVHVAPVALEHVRRFPRRGPPPGHGAVLLVT